MTPAELEGLANAYYEREKEEWRRFAWLGAIIINCFSKRKVKPRDLLPEVFKGEEKKISKEEAKRELEKLKKELGIK